VSSHLRRLIADFAFDFEVNGRLLPEVLEKWHFLMSDGGDFTSSVYIKGLFLTEGMICMRRSWVFDNPGILILERCSLADYQSAVAFYRLILNLGVSIMICIDKVPPALAGLLITEAFTAFCDVPREFCERLAQLGGLQIFSDVHEVTDSARIKFLGLFFGVPGEFDPAAVPIGDPLTPLLRNGFGDSRIAFFVPRGRCSEGAFLIRGESSRTLADIVRRMIVFVYHFDCLQSFLAAVPEWKTLPMAPRFNWFLASEDSSVDVFPYAILWTPTPEYNVSEVTYPNYYGAKDTPFSQFLDRFFALDAIDGVPAYGSVQEVDGSLPGLEGRDYLSIFHGKHRMVISSFSRILVPTDSESLVIFERDSVVKSVLHEDFFCISFSAQLEILFNRGFLGGLSRVTFVWRGKGIQFEIAPLSIFRIGDRPRTPPVAQITEQEVFASILFVAESLYGQALPKIRGPESAACFTELGSFVSDFGSRVLSGKIAPSFTRKEFFITLQGWFELVERLCPQMRSVKVPEFASSRSAS
jgi:hypothetical protein